MKVVLFDLDDTLFAHRESVRLGFAAHLSLQRELALVDVDAEIDRWVPLEAEHYPRDRAAGLGIPVIRSLQELPAHVV